MTDEGRPKSVKDYVLHLATEQPNLSNEKIAQMVRKVFPGATTTPASVSSIKSVARRNGALERVALPILADQLSIEEEEEIPEDAEPEVPESVIWDRIQRRFKALDRMSIRLMQDATRPSIKGRVASLICSGPPGLGKSFGVEQALAQIKEQYAEEWANGPRTLTSKCPKCKEELEEDSGQWYCVNCQQFVTHAEGVEFGSEYPYEHVKGTISGPGLYIQCWNLKDGGTLILDDCDSVFDDEDCLNILKTILDSQEKRVVSWRKQARWLVDLGIDDQFEFKGSVVFLTNKDFERIIESGRAYAVHFKALMDRSLYLHLTIRTVRDFWVRIKQVVYGERMLEHYGLTDEDTRIIMRYVWQNRRRFYGLSLRLIHHIALCYAQDKDNWEVDVEMTKMKAFTEDLVDDTEPDLWVPEAVAAARA